MCQLQTFEVAIDLTTTNPHDCNHRQPPKFNHLDTTACGRMRCWGTTCWGTTKGCAAGSRALATTACGRMSGWGTTCWGTT